VVSFSFLEAGEVLSWPDATPGTAGTVSVDVTVKCVGSEFEFVVRHCWLL
jgi:hypothetical protein